MAFWGEYLNASRMFIRRIPCWPLFEIAVIKRASVNLEGSGVTARTNEGGTSGWNPETFPFFLCFHDICYLVLHAVTASL